MNRQTGLNLPTLNVWVIGAGGIGSWVALALLKAGCIVHAWDADLVAPSNLHRTPFLQRHVGQRKTVAVADLSDYPLTLHSHADFHPAVADVTTASAGEPDVVVCCVDRLSVRHTIYEWCQQQHDVRYVDAACDGHEASVASAPALATLAPDTGYETVAQWVGPCLWAASMAVAAVMYPNVGDGDVGYRHGRTTTDMDGLLRRE